MNFSLNITNGESDAVAKQCFSFSESSDENCDSFCDVENSDSSDNVEIGGSFGGGKHGDSFIGGENDDSFVGGEDHNFTFSIIVDPTSTGGKLA